MSDWEMSCLCVCPSSSHTSLVSVVERSSASGGIEMRERGEERSGDGNFFFAVHHSCLCRVPQDDLQGSRFSCMTLSIFSLSLSTFVSISQSLSLSLSLTFSLSLSLAFSPPPFLLCCLSLSFCLFNSTFSLYISPFIPLSFFLSLTLFFSSVAITCVKEKKSTCEKILSMT